MHEIGFIGDRFASELFSFTNFKVYSWTKGQPIENLLDDIEKQEFKFLFITDNLRSIINEKWIKKVKSRGTVIVFLPGIIQNDWKEKLKVGNA